MYRNSWHGRHSASYECTALDLRLTHTNMSSRQRSPSPERRSRHSKHPNRDDDEYRDYRDKRHDKNEDKNNDSNDESRPLPHDAPQLSDSDYFLRNTEFRKWLKDEKDRVSE